MGLLARRTFVDALFCACSRRLHAVACVHVNSAWVEPSGTTHHSREAACRGSIHIFSQELLDSLQPSLLALGSLELHTALCFFPLWRLCRTATGRPPRANRNTRKTRDAPPRTGQGSGDTVSRQVGVFRFYFERKTLHESLLAVQIQIPSPTCNHPELS